MMRKWSHNMRLSLLFSLVALLISPHLMLLGLIVLLVLGKPLLEKLDRIKTKYGILDDEGRKEA